MVAYAVIDRLNRKRTHHTKTVTFFLKCTVCGQPLSEAPFNSRVGSVIKHFCKYCDEATDHKVTKEFPGKH